MQEELLLKFIKKEASTEEKELVTNWILEKPENQKKYNLLKANYVANTLKNVRNEEYHYDHSFSKQKYPPKSIAILKYSIAASIILLIGIFFFRTFQNTGSETIDETKLSRVSETIKIRTENELNHKIQLPDGSTVLLNSGSEIDYPEIFSDTLREVTLTGEAFFDIVHKENKPFIVRTKDFNVKVLGTSFNVKSYPEDKQTETTLVTGKIVLLREKETPVLLTPSHKAIFDKENKKIEIEEVASVVDAVAWQNGKLIFNKTPLEQVIIDMERKYNVEISINSPKLLDYQYTGTFDNLTINEALKLLMISSPITHKTENNKITLTMK